MRISLPPRSYPDNRATAIVDFFKRLDEQVSAIPGVQIAGYTTIFATDRLRMDAIYHRRRPPIPKTPEETPMVHYRQISSHYFETLGIRLLKGRALNERDTRDTEPVAVVNESFARSLLSE